MVNSVSTLGGFPHILTSHIFTLGSPHVHWISTHSTHNCETTNHYSARVRTPPKTPPTGSTHTHTHTSSAMHRAQRAKSTSLWHRPFLFGATLETRGVGPNPRGGRQSASTNLVQLCRTRPRHLRGNQFSNHSSRDAGVWSSHHSART